MCLLSYWPAWSYLSLRWYPFGITGGNTERYGYVSFDFVESSVPEPSTWAMTLTGFAGLSWLARLRKRKLTPV
jgi:hypothetical protein